MVVVVLQDPGEAEHKFIDKIRENLMTKPDLENHGTSASSSSSSGSAGDGAPPVSGNQSVVVWSPDSDVLLLLMGCYHTSGGIPLEANLCFLHERRAPGPGRRTAHPLVASSCDARVSVQSRNSCPSWPTSVRCTSC